MIAGIVGLFVAFLIMLLVILFGKRKLDPTIALPLNNFLTSQGFTLVDSSDPILKDITADFRLTAYIAHIEQVYKKVADKDVVCWLADSDGTTNHLAAAIPKTINSGPWIMLCLPSIKGMIGNIIRKSFDLSLSSSLFSKVEPDVFGQSIIQYDLYTQSGASMPSFRNEFLHLLSQCGNIVLRSTGGLVLVERISINRTETWEHEARELLRITQLLKGWL